MCIRDSTNGVHFGEIHYKTVNTTPESYEIQKTFREMVKAGCECVCMEVSSQGLMTGRVAGIQFQIGVFTNLSPDHIGPKMCIRDRGRIDCCRLCQWSSVLSFARTKKRRRRRTFLRRRLCGRV